MKTVGVMSSIICALWTISKDIDKWQKEIGIECPAKFLQWVFLLRSGKIIQRVYNIQKSVESLWIRKVSISMNKNGLESNQVTLTASDHNWLEALLCTLFCLGIKDEQKKNILHNTTDFFVSCLYLTSRALSPLLADFMRISDHEQK